MLSNQNANGNNSIIVDVSSITKQLFVYDRKLTK